MKVFFLLTPLSLPLLFGMAVEATPLLPAGWADARTEARKVPVQDTNFFVDGAKGDDRNPGSAEQPWRTIQKAADMLRAGQVGIVRSGVYHETVRFTHSGDVLKPIVLAAADGAEVIIDGKDSLPGERWGGLVDLRHCCHVKVIGLHLVHSRYAGVFADDCEDVSVQGVVTGQTWSSGLQFWNCRKVEVRGNDVRRACEGTAKNGEGTQECITLASCFEFHVDYNEVSERTTDVGDGGEGIDAKQSCHNGRICHNVVHDLARLGIYVDAYDKALTGVEVVSNIVFHCENGIAVSAERKGTAKSVSIRDNLVFENRENGIVVTDFVDDGVRTGIVIERNTVVRNGRSDWGGGIFVGTRNPQTRDITITRNIASQNGAWQIAVMAMDLPYVIVRDNLIDGFRGYDGGAQGEKEIKGDGAVVGQPGFADPAGSNYILPPENPWRERGWGAALLPK